MNSLFKKLAAFVVAGALGAASVTALAAPAPTAPTVEKTLYTAFPNVPAKMVNKKGETLFLVAYNNAENEAVYLDAEGVAGFLSGADRLDVSASYKTLKDFKVPVLVANLKGDAVAPASICDDTDSWPLDFDRDQSITKWYGPAYITYELNITWTYDYCSHEITDHAANPSWEAIGYIVTQETPASGAPSDTSFWNKHTWRFESTVPRLGGMTRWIKGTVNSTSISWTNG